MRNGVIGAVFLLSLVGCFGRSDSPTRNAKVTRYPNGALRTVQEFIYDTIQDGTYVRYYQDVPAIEIIIHYSYDRKHGEQTAYYRSGQIESRLNFINGKEEGEARWFCENGNLTSWVIYRHGRKLSPGLVYYDTGEFLGSIAYGDSNKVVYRIDYDKDGRVLKEGGKRPVEWDALVNRSRFIAEESVTTVVPATSTILPE